MTCRGTQRRARVAALALLTCMGLALGLPIAASAIDNSPLMARSLPRGWVVIAEDAQRGQYELAHTAQVDANAEVTVTFCYSSQNLYGPNSNRGSMPVPRSFSEFKNIAESYAPGDHPGVERRFAQTGVNGQAVWSCTAIADSPYSPSTRILVFNPSNQGGTWVMATYEVGYGGTEDGTLTHLKSQVNGFLNSLTFKQNDPPSLPGAGDAPTAPGGLAAWLASDGSIPGRTPDDAVGPLIAGWLAALLAAACAVTGLAFSLAIESGRKVGPRTPVGFALHVSSRQLKVGRDRPSTFTAKAWRVLASGTPEAATDVTVSVAPPEGVAVTATTGAGTLRTTLLQTAEVISPAHLIVTATAPTGGTQAAVAIEAE